jgi:hypothetical protein
MRGSGAGTLARRHVAGIGNPLGGGFIRRPLGTSSVDRAIPVRAVARSGKSRIVR